MPLGGVLQKSIFIWKCKCSRLRCVLLVAIGLTETGFISRVAKVWSANYAMHAPVVHFFLFYAYKTNQAIVHVSITLNHIQGTLFIKNIGYYNRNVKFLWHNLIIVIGGLMKE